ncbi:MAG: ABC transporter ATP-binding protein [bacterium]
MSNILQLQEVKKGFRWSSGLMYQKVSDNKGIWAVNNVSINIKNGESVGLVGESGCGKTTIGKAILRLFPSLDSGSIHFGQKSKCVFEYSMKELSEYRHKVQMIFQNPDASLNPRMLINNSIKEAVRIGYKQANKREIAGFVRMYLEKMNLDPKRIDDYPDDLSGGEKRRVGIIRALAVKPQLIVADEPFSGLDVSNRNHILSIFMKIQEEDNVTFFLISHDIGVLKHLTSQIVTMYTGRVIEICPTTKMIAGQAVHPYTKGLLAASRYDQSITISWKSSQGDTGGCLFHERCHFYQRQQTPKRLICTNNIPLLLPVDSEHWVACHFWHEM